MKMVYLHHVLGHAVSNRYDLFKDMESLYIWFKLYFNCFILRLYDLVCMYFRRVVMIFSVK